MMLCHKQWVFSFQRHDEVGFPHLAAYQIPSLHLQDFKILLMATRNPGFTHQLRERGS